MKHIFYIFLIVLINSTFINAQEINVLDIDESEFPLIKAKIEIKSTENHISGNFKILENSQAINFNIDSISCEKEGKTVLFLLDNRFYQNQKSLKEISNIISNSIKNFNENDYANVIVTSSKQDDYECIMPLSFEFTDDFNSFSDNLYHHFELLNLTNNNSDLDCSIEKSLDFFNSKKKLTDNKFLTVIVKNFDSNSINLENLKRKAAECKINLKFVVCEKKQEKLKSEDIIIQNPDCSIQKLKSAYENSININNNGYLYSNKYLVKFYTKQNKKINKFIINYEDKTVECNFIQPEYIGFFKNNLPLIIFFTISSVIFSFFIFHLYFSKKKISESLFELKKSIINKQYSSNYHQITDVKHITPIGNEKHFPKMIIKFRGETNNFEIKKLIIRIGRHNDNDIVIGDLTISNHHAILTNEGGEFYLQDIGSTNGIIVNEIKISKSLIKPEDNIRMGKAALKLIY
ncbi:MAG: FHA domain-containing protein [Bacteroidales bacterium]|nr:FHA domain-containing protein [Bacteroidales bacterium]MBN2756085.1 FHA domain-containing protein [Bacteroidales bacterium]